MISSIARQIKPVCTITAVVVVTYLSYRLSTSKDSRQFMNPSQTIKSTTLPANLSEKNKRWMEWVKVTSQRSQTPAQKRLPDIIGIGVKKCGTGAMIRFLAQHPLVETSDTVETMFFSHLDRYQRGLEYYMNLMPQAYSHQLIAEKSPAYFTTPGALNRIKTDVPNARLILSLCDPTNRAFSDFVQTYVTTKDNASKIADKFHQNVITFLDLLSNSKSIEDSASIAEQACRKRELNCIFSKGVYFPGVSKWQNSFNKSQLLVINGEKWMTNPGELLEEEIDFLNLPKLITSDDFVKNPHNGLFCIKRWWHKLFHRRLKTVGETEVDLKNGTVLFCLGRHKGRTRNGALSMHDKTRILLRNFYLSHNQRLYELLGRSFNW